MPERTITASEVTIAADDDGEGVPVVLAHGLTATHHYVVMGSRGLVRSGHRVIAYDARGHGQSSPAPAPDAYGYDLLTADLEAVMDACGLERAVLAGSSMGAHTILRYAIDAPQRVAGLVAITPGYDPQTRLDERRLARWDALGDALRGDGIEGFVAAFDVSTVPQAWRATVTMVLRQRLARHEHLDAVADALHRVPRSWPFEELADLTAIQCPVIVVGSRDEADPSHPLALARAYADVLPGGRLEVEVEGRSPLAWQGGQLSKLIARLAAQAW